MNGSQPATDHGANVTPCHSGARWECQSYTADPRCWAAGGAPTADEAVAAASEHTRMTGHQVYVLTHHALVSSDETHRAAMSALADPHPASPSALRVSPPVRRADGGARGTPLP